MAEQKGELLNLTIIYQFGRTGTFKIHEREKIIDLKEQIKKKLKQPNINKITLTLCEFQKKKDKEKGGKVVNCLKDINDDEIKLIDLNIDSNSVIYLIIRKSFDPEDKLVRDTVTLKLKNIAGKDCEYELNKNRTISELKILASFDNDEEKSVKLTFKKAKKGREKYEMKDDQAVAKELDNHLWKYLDEMELKDDDIILCNRPTIKYQRPTEYAEISKVYSEYKENKRYIAGYIFICIINHLIAAFFQFRDNSGQGFYQKKAFVLCVISAFLGVLIVLLCWNLACLGHQQFTVFTFLLLVLLVLYAVDLYYGAGALYHNGYIVNLREQFMTTGALFCNVGLIRFFVQSNLLRKRIINNQGYRT